MYWLWWVVEDIVLCELAEGAEEACWCGGAGKSRCPQQQCRLIGLQGRRWHGGCRGCNDVVR